VISSEIPIGTESRVATGKGSVHPDFGVNSPQSHMIRPYDAGSADDGPEAQYQPAESMNFRKDQDERAGVGRSYINPKHINRKMKR
jgi:hypothetical protein